MNHKYKYLSKNFILFSISSIGPKIIAFIMVPLYTNYLSTSDYGRGDIVTTSASLILPLVVMCVESAVLRFCFDENYNHPFKNVLNIVLILFPVPSKIELVKKLHTKLNLLQQI